MAVEKTFVCLRRKFNWENLEHFGMKSAAYFLILHLLKGKLAFKKGSNVEFPWLRKH